MYIERYYHLPFPLFGYEAIKTSPAVVYAVTNTAFASLISPFAGFWASGFKRANNIKDFGSSLPGHGGFTDRLDCMSLIQVFNFILLTSFAFKDDLQYNDAITNAMALPSESKENLLAYLSSSLNIRS